MGIIYMDAAASTPLSPEAFELTASVLRQSGNPGAAHAAGWAAAEHIDIARNALAELLEVGPGSVLLVGSATEANNLALRGIDRAETRAAVVTTSAEHPSVLATVVDVAGPDGTRLAPVTNSGEIDLDALSSQVDDSVALVSVHAANNETGVIQPIDAIVHLAHAVGALIHVDASQLMAWGPTSLLAGADLITVSSHKMHGPQGAAALIVAPAARQRLRPQITGGGQEHGLRSGTPNVAAIAGFGAAAQLSLASGAEVAERVTRLRDRLRDGLRASVGDVVEHGAGAKRRLPGILNVAIGTEWADSVESEALLARLPNLAASTGSACHAGAPEPSPVLQAMGASRWEAARSIRLSLSRYTTDADVEAAIAELSGGYNELRLLLGSSEPEKRYAL